MVGLVFEGRAVKNTVQVEELFQSQLPAQNTAAQFPKRAARDMETTALQATRIRDLWKELKKVEREKVDSGQVERVQSISQEQGDQAGGIPAEKPSSCKGVQEDSTGVQGNPCSKVFAT